MKPNTRIFLIYCTVLIVFCAIWLFIPFSDYLADNVAKTISFDPTTFLYLIIIFAFLLTIFKIIIGIKNILK